MAYNQLISNLKQYIRENGNEEITGQIMQDALIAIVKALSTYQQFGGMASDVEEPDTENNVFYFALKGTYPQFGGLEVGDFEIGIFISYEDPEDIDEEGFPVIKWKDVGIPVPPGPEGPAGRGVPDGGTTGQVLAKRSNTDGDTEWVPQGGVTIPDGCLYGGVIRPSSYPLNDKRFFYITDTPGTYTHFNNLEIISNNITVIYWVEDGEFWNMEFFGISEEGVDKLISDRFKLLYGDLGFDVFLSSQSYSVGDYVTNFEIGGLYRFTSNHIGAWDDNDVEEVTPIDYIDGLLSGVNNKADKVSGATAGNLAGLDSNGNLTDSGSKPSDFASASDVNDIKGKIPAQASSQNQLADKDFVNSSIATATATFKGTFNLVTDLSLSTSASQSDIATALAGAVSGEDNNDYAFVQIPTSDSTPTEISRVDRYKYNGTAWGYEFSLNNSSFTSSQWAAINSGITASLVNSFGNKYEKPSGGIPKTDLASGVQTSLGKADTALQSYTESDPIFQASPAAGITSGDIADWDGKADPIPVVDASTIPASMDADKVYQYGTLAGDTTFPALNAPTDLTVAHVYCWTFATPATAPTITWPAAITAWAGGSAPTINASKNYEVSVMDGLATIIEA